MDSDILRIVAAAADSQHVIESSPFVRARLFLPIRLDGCGLQSKVTKRAVEFLGGMHQGLSGLLDRQVILQHGNDLVLCLVIEAWVGKVTAAEHSVDVIVIEARDDGLTVQIQELGVRGRPPTTCHGLVGYRSGSYWSRHRQLYEKVVDAGSGEALAGTTAKEAYFVKVDSETTTQSQTREHILLARQVGVPAVVFVNVDGFKDAGEVEQTSTMIHELLHAVGYSEVDSAVVIGSVEAALAGERAGLIALIDLMDALDRCVGR